ncbi:putative UBX domain protein [Hypoxylon cercidicola]|nr:putative UBX domain protein [Hypoxylon cercidicola]
MATNVKVVGTDLRQVTVKVNPLTHLTEILEGACEKLKVSPDKYTLKYKQKQLDMSQTWRTSGLIQGAKLELVVRSNTPTAINVALQLPSPEATLFPPAGRLTEKLSTDYTLWKVLRQFESGRAAEGKNLNITARGVAQTASGTTSGSGQLYYETPVLIIDTRTFSSFADFQKTLSQLGYTSGSGVLIRLSFKKSDKTLADAMGEISQFFKTEADETQETQESTVPPAAASGEPTASTDTPNIPPAQTSDTPEANASEAVQTNDAGGVEAPPADAMDVDEPPSSDHRQVTIYSAPTSNTPAAVFRTEPDEAFAPRIEHAQSHQRQLKAAGENKRLLSDKELEEKAAAAAAKVAAVKSIRIRVRFPDNFSAEWTFGPDDTGAALYSEVRKIMANDAAPFKLALPPGTKTVIRDDGSGPASRLIGGYKLNSNTLVNFMWDESVPAEIRKQPFLKRSAAGQAQQVVVPEVPEVQGGDEAGPSANVSAPAPKPKTDREGSMLKTPKWLKGLSKK